MDRGIPMEPTDSQTLTSLTDEQIERLAAVVLDEFGPSLSRRQFDDVALALFEDVPGSELMTANQIAWCCTPCGFATARSPHRTARTEHQARRFNPPWNRGSTSTESLPLIGAVLPPPQSHAENEHASSDRQDEEMVARLQSHHAIRVGLRSAHRTTPVQRMKGAQSSI
jgi:hypothetical protein